MYFCNKRRAMKPILIIEDDRRLAEIIQRGLETNDYPAHVAYDGRMGLKLALANDYALIISDIVLPEMNGLDLCRKIRVNKPEVPVLMLTALGTTDDKVEGFDAGADDYLIKPFEFRELLARIRALLKRAGNVRVGATPFLVYEDLEMDIHRKTARRAGKDIALTPKEFKLLEYMVRNPERVIPRSELAEKVWDTHFDTGTNFIDVYINYLRKKIDKPFGKKMIHTRAGMGFLLSKDMP